jgi:hypothetical protein
MLFQNLQIKYPALRLEKMKISRLINSIYYFIEIFFIKIALIDSKEKQWTFFNGN